MQLQLPPPQLDGPISRLLGEAAEFAKIRHYGKGQTVFREGDPEERFYILLRGIVTAYRTGANGHQRILQFFVPNDVYGNITMVDNLVHTMTAEVVEPADNLEIEKRYIKQLVRQNPDFLWYLYEDLAKKLCNVAEIIETSYLTAEQRISRGIVKLSRQFGYRTEHGIELRLHLTQEQLARFTGTTRVTVAKTVSSLTDQGILSTRPKPWVVHHVDALIQFGQNVNTEI